MLQATAASSIVTVAVGVLSAASTQTEFWDHSFFKWVVGAAVFLAASLQIWAKAIKPVVVGITDMQTHGPVLIGIAKQFSEDGGLIDWVKGVNTRLEHGGVQFERMNSAMAEMADSVGTLAAAVAAHNKATARRLARMEKEIVNQRALLVELADLRQVIAEVGGMDAESHADVTPLATNARRRSPSTPTKRVSRSRTS